ncbi:DUF1772 domain-containing protein [Streptomyces sp. NPDC003077]|uniref:anthrone oxygenase family protein n=1 Tax=Streptomyces sp. NPDC003077 TaxID=3154443 RepID=UPI0033ACA189
MYESFSTAALVVATITTGLAAGLFFAFSRAVMPGLRRADDRTFVTATRHINRAILNGWFALVFAGTPVFTAVAAALHLRDDGRSALPWILASLVLYVAVLVITRVVNIPLNNRLDAAGDPGRLPDSELAQVRADFEERWVRWNVVRTLLNTAALGCLTWALIVHRG